MRDLTNRKSSSVHIYTSSNPLTEKNRLFTYKDDLVHDDITSLDTIKSIFDIIYNDDTVKNNVNMIYVDFYSNKNISFDLVIDLLKLLNTYQTSTTKTCAVIFKQDFINGLSDEQIETLVNTLGNVRLHISIPTVDDLPSTFLFEKYPALLVFYYLIITNDTDLEYYQMFLSHYFKIANNVNKNAFRFMFSPFREKYTLSESKFKALFSEIAFDSESCNIYSDNIAIDIINKNILKCYRLFDMSPYVELTDENLQKVLTYQNTDIFAQFDYETYCSKCKFYNFNRKLLITY